MGGWSLARGWGFKVALVVGLLGLAVALTAGALTSFSTAAPRSQRNTLFEAAGQDPKLRLLDADLDDVPDVRENRLLSTDRLEQDSDADGMPDAWEAHFGLNPNDASDSGQDPDRDGLDSTGEYAAALASLKKRGFASGFDPAKGLDPTNADTDNDKLPDGWEVKYGLDPLLTSGLEEDLDGDGLTNRDEHDAGSDPTNFDTDSDGLSDGREVKVLKTNPSSRDSDGDGMEDAWEVEKTLDANNPNDRFEDPDKDGLLNLVEYRHKTEPRIADTDGDSIPDGWEVDFRLDPTNFADGVADPDADGLTNAGEYGMAGGLYQQSTDPLNPDTDLDSLPDGLESRYETNPFRDDTDRDDLTDGEEILQYGTKPLTPDSDGDDLSDGDEIRVTRTNATAYDSDADDLPDGAEYKYWVQRAAAAREAVETSGKLATWLMLQFPGADQDVLVAQLGPDGDPDKDGLRNILDEDADADELKDGEETGMTDTALCGTGKGLDPANPDTDEDRMPDGWEFFGKLDPCDPKDAADDPDKDGLVLFGKPIQDPSGNGTFATIKVSPPDRIRPPGYDVSMTGGLPKFTNLMEYLNKTSPVHADSDCDGLPDGWEVYYRRSVKVGGTNQVALLPNPGDRNNPDSHYDLDADGYDHQGFPSGPRDGVIRDDENFTMLEEWYYFTDPFNNNTDGAEFVYKGNKTFVGDGAEVYFGQEPDSNPGATPGLTGNGRAILEVTANAKTGGSCHPKYEQLPWGLQGLGPAPGAPGAPPPSSPPGGALAVVAFAAVALAAAATRRARVAGRPAAF